VSCPGYSEFLTQVFFAGGPRLRWDPWVKPSLVVDLSDEQNRDGKMRLRATFNFALE